MKLFLSFLFLVTIALSQDKPVETAGFNKEQHSHILGQWYVDLRATVKNLKESGSNLHFFRNFSRGLAGMNSLWIRIEEDNITVFDRQKHKMKVDKVLTGKNELKVILDDHSNESATVKIIGNNIQFITRYRKSNIIILGRNNQDHKVLDPKLRKEFKVDEYLKNNPYTYIEDKNQELLKEYFKENPKAVNKVDLTYGSPLHYAASCGNTEALKLLIESNADLSLRYGSSKKTALLAVHRSADAIRILVDAGADINSVNSSKMTPLIQCISNRNFEGALYLIKKGSDLNHMDENNESVLRYMVNSDAPDSFYEALKKENVNFKIEPDIRGVNPIHFAIIAQKKDFLKKMVEHGLSINFKNESGLTPLHISYSKSDMLKFFLDNVKGIDINSIHKYDRQTGFGDGSALKFAMSAENLESMKVLLSFGAEIPEGYDSAKVKSEVKEEGQRRGRRNRREAIKKKLEEKHHYSKEVHALIKAHLDKLKEK